MVDTRPPDSFHGIGGKRAGCGACTPKCRKDVVPDGYISARLLGNIFKMKYNALPYLTNNRQDELDGQDTNGSSIL